MRRIFTIAFLVSIGIVALIGIMMLLIPGFDDAEEILISCLIAAAFNLLAAMQSLFYFRGRLKYMAITGLVSAGISAACLLILVWAWRVVPNEAIIRAAGFTAIVAGWTTLSGMILIIPLRAKWTIWTQRSLIVLAGIPALLGLWGTVDDNSIERAIRVTVGDEYFARLMGVDTILFSAGLICIVVIAIIERRHGLHERESIDRRIHVAINCPRCNSEQNIPTGHAKCSQCGLNISVEVDEPRCACGYLLHELRSRTCPECGREVPKGDQWPWNDQSEESAPNLNA